MAFIEYSDISCGVIQLGGLEETEKAVKAVNQQWRDAQDTEFPNAVDSFCMVMFSDAVVNGNGDLLVNTIKKEKLGLITASQVENNPNSYNDIQVWIWSPDFDALEAYCA